jgi:hypothetical protein
LKLVCASAGGLDPAPANAEIHRFITDFTDVERQGQRE